MVAQMLSQRFETKLKKKKKKKKHNVVNFLLQWLNGRQQQHKRCSFELRWLYKLRLRIRIIILASEGTCKVR